MSIPNCTLSTACFCMHTQHCGARPLVETIESANALMKIPVYLVIYGDKQTIPLLRERRTSYGLDGITQFVEIEPNELWSFQYLDKVRENRAVYFPSRDERTSAETHLVTCNKFSFVLQTIENNPFQTTRFGWIDAFLGKDSVKICEDYEPNILPWVLSNISDKFHIQVLNVCDKKYKLVENKKEYYSRYQWVVCGGFFTCGVEIGRRILHRLNEIFVFTTLLGFGHGEEMFYLEILDEFYDDINRSYGDYGQILNNFIYPCRNLHYVYYLILRKYVEMSYWREGFDCSQKIIQSIESHTAYLIPEMFVTIYIDHFICAYYHKPEVCIDFYKHMMEMVMRNPLLNKEYEKQCHRIEWYIHSIREIYGAGTAGSTS